MPLLKVLSALCEAVARRVKKRHVAVVAATLTMMLVAVWTIPRLDAISSDHSQSTGPLNTHKVQVASSKVQVGRLPAKREFPNWNLFYKSRSDQMHRPAYSVAVFNNQTQVVGHVPSFIVPGVMKGGTTFLRMLLVQHPNLVSAHRHLARGNVRANLEGHFFDVEYERIKGQLKASSSDYEQFNAKVLQEYSDYNFDESISEYETQLDAHGPALRFDVTPRYLKMPQLPETLRGLLPHMKFVIVLRDPTERYRSHLQYLMCHKQRSGVPPGFHNGAGMMGSYLQSWKQDPNSISLKVDNGWRDNPLERGLYVEPLQALLAKFNRSSLLVIRSEDLFADPLKEARKILQFMALPTEFAFDPEKAKSNKMNTIAHCLDTDAYFPDEDRKAMQLFYAEKNQELSELLGMEFTWLNGLSHPAGMA